MEREQHCKNGSVWRGSPFAADEHQRAVVGGVCLPLFANPLLTLR